MKLKPAFTKKRNVHLLLFFSFILLSSILFANPDKDEAEAPLSSSARLSIGEGFRPELGILGSDMAIFSTGFFTPTGVAFSNDGNSMFVVNDADNSIYQFALSTPYEVSSGFTEVDSYGLADTRPAGVAFSSDGTKMFIAGNNNDRIYQYTLGTPFDLTGTKTVNGSVVISTYESAISGITISEDGSNMYIVGTDGDEINQFSLTTANSITGGITHEGLFDISDEENIPQAVFISNDGKRMHVGGNQQTVFTYELTTAFDVTSADLISSYLVDESLLGMTFSESGDKIYILGNTREEVFQININAGFFEESVINDGTITGSIPITITGDTFTSSGSILTESTDYTVTGLPVGLTPVISVAADGLSALLSFSGKAISNNIDAENQIFIDISFNSSAFTTFTATEVCNANTSSLGLYFDFIDNPKLTYGYSFDLTNGVSLEASRDLTSDETDATGITFNNDGTKLYICGRTGDDITQYSLTTPYDISSGVSLDGTSGSLATFQASVQDLEFSNDGLTLFIIGTNADRVTRFTLNTAFDVTDGLNDEDLVSLSGQESFPTGLAFNDEGNELYTIGSDDEINRYNLSTNFDFSTVGSFSSPAESVAAQVTFPTDITFSRDGMSVFVSDLGSIVSGSASDKIYQYSLMSPYDVLSGITLEEEVEIDAAGFEFSGDGTSLFALNVAFDEIRQYSINRGVFTENAANDGSVNGEIVIFLEGDTFANAGAILTSGVDYSIVGLPTGFTPNLAVASDGRSATLTLSGSTANNDVTDNVDNLIFTFSNSAFINSNADIVVNAINSDSDLGIEFIESPPVVTSLIPPANDNYGSGSDLVFTVNFDKVVTVDETGGTPFLQITIDGNQRQAALSGGSGSTSLTFTYTVQSNEEDNDGFTFLLNANGGTITGPLDQDAILTLNNIGNTTGIDIDGVNAVVTSVAVPDAGTYFIDDVLVFTYNFDETILVDETDGSPTLRLRFNSSSSTFRNVPISSSTATSITFQYTVVDGDIATGGVDVMSLDLNGGTIKDDAGNDSNRNANNVGETENILVDGSIPNQLPTVVTPFTDQVYDDGFESSDIDLINVFDDADGDDLSYAAVSMDTDVVTVGVVGSTLTITEVGAGTTIVSVTANDGNGGSVDDDFSVTVNPAPNSPPILLMAIPDQVFDEGFVSTTIDLTTIFDDEDGNDLGYSVSSDDTDVVTVSIENDLLTITEIGMGIATISIAAGDGSGEVVSDEFTFTVNEAPNNPPTIVFAIGDRTFEEGFNIVTFNLNGVFEDADGDELTFSASSNDTDVATVTISSSTLTVTEVGIGTTSITATANDGNGGTVSDVFMFTIDEAPNNPPTVISAVSDQSFEEGFGTSTVDLGSVFNDEDGDELTFSASSNNNDVVSLGILGTTLTIFEEGVGTAIVTLSADDANGGTVDDVFIVSVNAESNNSPEIIAPIADQTLEEGFGSTNIDLTNVFSDPDSDALEYIAIADDSNVISTTVSGSSLTLTEVGIGQTVVTVTATDGNGGTASDMFEVVVNRSNTPPILSSAFPNQTLSEDFGDLTINLSDNFSDPDGDVLSYSASSDNTEVVSTMIDGNVLTVLVEGVGIANVTVSANDGNGGSVDDTFRVTIAESTNSIPMVASEIVDKVLEMGFDELEIDLSVVFTDGDGDELTFSAVSEEEEVVTVSIEVNILTLSEVGLGTSSISVTADDGKGGSAENIFTVEVLEEVLSAGNDLDVTIYPNPFVDHVYISNTDIDLPVLIYDLQGNQILRSKGNWIDMSGLEAGVYLLKVEANSGESIFKRIIKN